MAIALYPGAFKPPHRGHFEVVRKLLDGTHGGKLYTQSTIDQDASSALSGSSDNVEPITKVVIFIGAKQRNGISTDISVAIWEVYKKYLGDVELYYEVANPMQNASAYAKKRPEEKFYAITGIRGEEDMVDLKRLSSFKNRENVEGLIIAAPGGTRATDLRQAILSGNLDTVRDFFPAPLKREEMLGIIRMLKDSIIAENMHKALEDALNELFEGEDTQEESATPKTFKPIRSVDRVKLNYLYNYLSNLIPSGVSIRQIDDRISIFFDQPLTEGEEKSELTKYIGSILEYMLEKKMNITPLPEIKVREDEQEAKNFFGRTAYYDPNEKEIVLYTAGRHPKDICRSFTHEMVHHIQNIEGRLGDITTSNTNEDDELLELEKEAYLVGNITFRNWEDSVK